MFSSLLPQWLRWKTLQFIEIRYYLHQKLKIPLSRSKWARKNHYFISYVIPHYAVNDTRSWPIMTFDWSLQQQLPLLRPLLSPPLPPSPTGDTYVFRAPSQLDEFLLFIDFPLKFITLFSKIANFFPLPLISSIITPAALWKCFAFSWTLERTNTAAAYQKIKKKKKKK